MTASVVEEPKRSCQSLPAYRVHPWAVAAPHRLLSSLAPVKTQLRPFSGRRMRPIAWNLCLVMADWFVMLQRRPTAAWAKRGCEETRSHVVREAPR